MVKRRLFYFASKSSLAIPYIYINNIIKLYTDHTGNMHDTIDTQQITAPIMNKYIRYSEASKCHGTNHYIITILH